MDTCEADAGCVAAALEELERTGVLLGELAALSVARLEARVEAEADFEAAGDTLSVPLAEGDTDSDLERLLDAVLEGSVEEDPEALGVFEEPGLRETLEQPVLLFDAAGLRLAAPLWLNVAETVDEADAAGELDALDSCVPPVELDTDAVDDMLRRGNLLAAALALSETLADAHALADRDTFGDALEVSAALALATEEVERVEPRDAVGIVEKEGLALTVADATGEWLIEAGAVKVTLDVDVRDALGEGIDDALVRRDEEPTVLADAAPDNVLKCDDSALKLDNADTDAEAVALRDRALERDVDVEGDASAESDELRDADAERVTVVELLANRDAKAPALLAPEALGLPLGDCTWETRGENEEHAELLSDADSVDEDVGATLGVTVVEDVLVDVCAMLFEAAALEAAESEVTNEARAVAEPVELCNGGAEARGDNDTSAVVVADGDTEAATDTDKAADGLCCADTLTTEELDGTAEPEEPELDVDEGDTRPEALESALTLRRAVADADALALSGRDAELGGVGVAEEEAEDTGVEDTKDVGLCDAVTDSVTPALNVKTGDAVVPEAVAAEEREDETDGVVEAGVEYDAIALSVKGADPVDVKLPHADAELDTELLAAAESDSPEEAEAQEDAVVSGVAVPETLGVALTVLDAEAVGAVVTDPPTALGVAAALRVTPADTLPNDDIVADGLWTAEREADANTDIVARALPVVESDGALPLVGDVDCEASTLGLAL